MKTSNDLNKTLIAVAVISALALASPLANAKDKPVVSESSSSSSTVDSHGNSGSSSTEDSHGNSSSSSSDDSHGNSGSSSSGDSHGNSGSSSSGDSSHASGGSSSDDSGHTSGSSSSSDVSHLTSVNPTNGQFTFAGEKGNVTVTFSGASASHIWAGANPIDNQSYETVGDYVKNEFHSGAFVGSGYQVDNASSIMNGGDTATFSSPVAYNYLAIHFGQHEMIFDFGAKGVAANTAFQIATSGAAAGLSNFRAYSTGTPTATPIPAALWLFGSGLVGLLGFSKRKSTQTLSA